MVREMFSKDPSGSAERVDWGGVGGVPRSGSTQPSSKVRVADEASGPFRSW